MARRSPSAARALLAVAFGAAAAAQDPTPRTVEAFHTPDGSRFVLVEDRSCASVHWAIATWTDGADDPPGLIGLATTAARASMNGTFATGSRDPEAERAVLARLDDAWQRQMARPGDPAIAQEILTLDREAAQLGDPDTYRRVLAALPAHRPEVLERGPLSVFVLTTIDEALPDVAALLVERREQPALRGIERFWMEDLMARMQRSAIDAKGRLYAELLALELPGSPALRALEPPAMLAPRREQALQVWRATQHPSRTVHVLYGDLDAARARALLERAFATTSLPAPDARAAVPARPLSTERRSMISGCREPLLLLGWVLPAAPDPWTAAATALWLADGERGWLVQRLRRAGRAQATAQCRLPWPPDPSGVGLFVLEVADPSGKPGLLEELLGACKAAAERDPDAAGLAQANVALQREWNAIAGDPRAVAVDLAERFALRPDAPVEAGAPPEVPGASVRQLLQSTFAGRPAVVEGRR